MPKLSANEIYLGRCEDLLPKCPTMLDLILCDLPNGNGNKKSDSKIDLKLLWREYHRLLKPSGVVVLMSQFPYTYEIISSNISEFKYDLIWDKGRPGGFLNAKRSPLRKHEHVLVFYNGNATYNPQFSIGERNHSQGKDKVGQRKVNNSNYGDLKYVEVDESGRKYPTSILSYPKPHPPLYPTQKPVELFEYLIRTYSNPGELVLDNCIGSGTTAIAAMTTGRSFIGIDSDKKCVDLTNERIKSMKAGQRSSLKSIIGE